MAFTGVINAHPANSIQVSKLQSGRRLQQEVTRPKAAKFKPTLHEKSGGESGDNISWSVASPVLPMVI